MNKKVLLALAVLVCAFVPAVAQTTTGDDVVKITTNLVQVDVVVTRKGKVIKDLKAEDFEIFEDGKRQEITSFAYVSNIAETPSTDTKAPNPDPNSPPVQSAPAAASEVNRRTIAFVIDDYGLSAQSIADVRRQLRTFIDKQMNPNDLIAIIRTSHGRRELPHFTNDINRINQAWEQVQWNRCSRVGARTTASGGSTGTGCGRGVASFDESISSLRAIVTALGQVPGRKSMIVFSNDTPLREEEVLARGSGSVMQPSASTLEDSRNYNAPLRRVAELAIRSSVVIYAVDPGGLQVTSLTAADETASPMIAGSQGNRRFGQLARNRSKQIHLLRDGAEKIAKETGGFLTGDQNEFLDRILEDQSGYYLIGYRPGTESFNKRFHQLRARVKKSGYEVRTRSGFFGMSDEEAQRLKETKK